MNKTLYSGKGIAVALFVIFALSYLLFQTASLNVRLDKTNRQLAAQNEEAAQQAFSTQSEIDSQKSLLRPVLSPKEKLVIFPELDIALPYNSITMTLQYSYGGNNLRVTSTELVDHTSRQLSCSELVRVNVKNGSPYSPWEEAAGSIKLSDGRTLYILAAKAFKNNEASTEECATEVWTQITPQKVADEFKKARAY